MEANPGVTVNSLAHLSGKIDEATEAVDARIERDAATIAELRSALAGWIAVASVQGANVPADLKEWAWHHVGREPVEETTRRCVAKG